MCGVQGSDLPFWGPCLLRKATEVLAALTMDAQQNVGSRLSRKGLVRLRQTSARPRRAAPANRRGLHLCIGEGRECSTSRCRIRSRCEWCGMCRSSAPCISAFATAGGASLAEEVEYALGAGLAFNSAQVLGSSSVGTDGRHRPSLVILERQLVVGLLCIVVPNGSYLLPGLPI